MTNSNNTDVNNSQTAMTSPPKMNVRNMGEPIRLKGMENLCGITAHAVDASKESKQATILTRLAMTSDELSFHRIAEGLCSVIRYHTQQAGVPVRLENANTILLVIKNNGDAELWIDTAAISLQCRIKRSISAFSAVFESDIADITEMSFPLVNIESTDKVLCLFRQDWRFALFFDFNPDLNLSVDEVSKSLGALYRNLKYRHLYDTVADEAMFNELILNGWFPFVEIIPSEFRELAEYLESGFNLSDAESKLLANFNDERLENLLARWLTKPHFANKEKIFKSAIDAYKRQDAVSVIKTLLTEIEGVLMDAYKAVHGKGAKIKTLCEFAIESANQKTGQQDTLFLPAAFAKYLESHTFAYFDPLADNGDAGSRHAVGHGAAQADSYTLVCALQAILTLDQIAFYT
jgi:hypothetical protein